MLKGALKGVHFCRGVGVWGPFLHGTWKGAEFRLATVMACRGLGRGYRQKGGISYPQLFSTHCTHGSLGSSVATRPQLLLTSRLKEGYYV